MTFKVWIEIEELDEDGEHVADGGLLGVLPDPLGTFDTLEEARACQREVVGTCNSSALLTSDAR